MLIKLLILQLYLIQVIKSDEICIDLNGDQKIGVTTIPKKDWLTSSYPVCASFSNQINQTGWAQLHVWTQPESNYNDSTLAYLAGYIEGYLTKDLINMHYDNLWEKYCNGEMTFCRRAFDFFASNEAYIEQEALANRETDPYWHQVGLVLDQLTGMEEAINSKSSYQPGYRVNTKGKVYLVNTVADIMDLETALNRTVRTLAVGQSFCSSLVRYTGNDLLIGHNTWTQFSYMLRVLKKYEFHFSTTSTSGKLVPGSTITMSSYPGIIFSIDDFYLISSGLAIAETTNGNHNETSFDLLRPEGCVLTMIRTMVANRLARDGKSWAKVFEKFNSGTYNNQYMIVDYKKFKPGSTSRKVTDLLWIVEQMPGSMVYDDMSTTLITNGYWASYNIPYFQKTYHIAGYPPLVNKYGDFYIHELNPRAKLFRRKHTEAIDHKSLLQLLRYNNYTQDPESRCNCTPPYSASMSLACRGDLNDLKGVYSIPAQGVINEAAIDAKTTSFELFNKLKMYAISGPTYDNVPPFAWSNFTLANQLVHKGHPDLWVFKPVYFPDN